MIPWEHRLVCCAEPPFVWAPRLGADLACVALETLELRRRMLDGSGLKNDAFAQKQMESSEMVPRKVDYEHFVGLWFLRADAGITHPLPGSLGRRMSCFDSVAWRSVAQYGTAATDVNEIDASRSAGAQISRRILGGMPEGYPGFYPEGYPGGYPQGP